MGPVMPSVGVAIPSDKLRSRQTKAEVAIRLCKACGPGRMAEVVRPAEEEKDENGSS